MKIASWNVNSLRQRIDHLLGWLETARPDIVALQETKVTDELFPAAIIEAAGYHVAYSGQKSYNGVAILSREPASELLTDIPGLEDPQRRILAATIGDLRIVDLYVPNGSAVGTEKYEYKLQWLARMRDFLESELSRYSKLVVLGDFNIAPDDRDVHDPDEWRDKILCSEPEREALTSLTDLGLYDSFRLFEQEENLFSWWDYRAAGFRRNRGLRIDLILVSETLKACCRQSEIEVSLRRLEKPSDHAPVVAQFSSC